MQPPHDVVAAVTAWQPRVPADRQRDLPARTVNFLGKLRAGRRRSNDKDTTVRQVVWPAIGSRRQLAKRRRQAPRHLRYEWHVAVSGGDHHGSCMPGTLAALDAITAMDATYRQHRRASDDRCRKAG